MTLRKGLAAWALPAAAGVVAVLLLLPLLGLLVRTPWSRVSELLGSRAMLEALWLSVQCSTAAALLSLLLGLPLATWLAAGGGSMRAWVRALVILPMVLPPVVGGVALLLAYGRRGVAGGLLDAWFAVALPFTKPGVILAETYVAIPFFVLAAESGLRSFDARYAQAAATLGASPWRAFSRVTLPMVAPAVRAGLVVAWARALGEFGATITFAGNLAGHTRTMPLAVYVALEDDPDAAIVASLLLVVVSATVLVLLRKQWFPAR